MIDNKHQDLKWVSAYSQVLCINFTTRVDQVDFMCNKFGVSAYSQARLVAK